MLRKGLDTLQRTMVGHGRPLKQLVLYLTWDLNPATSAFVMKNPSQGFIRPSSISANTHGTERPFWVSIIHNSMCRNLELVFLPPFGTTVCFAQDK